MYVRHSTRIPVPVKACEAVLVDAVMAVAGDRPSVGFGVGPASVRKRVELVTGPAERLGDWLRIPVSWKASPGQAFFPVLDGYLQLESVTLRESRLALRADYQPPLGRLGQAIDAVALHAVVDATVRDFVEAVSSRVQLGALVVAG
ncbi:MAG: hypothetical protein ABI838_03050 [Chloroflexota bacterium]